MLKRADFLIDSEPVGSLAAAGLSYDELHALNPSLIQVSITPFGLTGPKSAWLASDITLMASAGPLAMTGDDELPPVRVSVPQAWNHAAAEAAVGDAASDVQLQVAGRDLLSRLAPCAAPTACLRCPRRGPPQHVVCCHHVAASCRQRPPWLLACARSSR